MAIFKKNSPGGHLSGRVGNVTYRNYGDKVVACAIPLTHNMSDSEAAVTDRDCFRVCSFMGKGINQIDILKRLWLDAPIPGKSVRNKVIKINKPRIKANPAYEYLMLVPAEDYFKAEVESFSFEDVSTSVDFVVTIKPLASSGIEVFNIKNISLQGLVCCSEPTDVNARKYSFLPLLPSMRPLDVNSNIEFRFPLIAENFILFGRYARRSLLLNLITYNTNFEPFEASENIHIVMD